MSVIFTRKSSKSGPSGAMMRSLLSAPNASRIIHKSNRHVVNGDYGMNPEQSEKIEGVGQLLSFRRDIPGV